MAAGDALNDLRRDIGVRNRWWYWRNYLNFNLWGDPSVGIYSFAATDDEPEPDADMGVDDVADAQVPDDQLDMDVADEFDAMVADDAAVEAADAGVEPEMNEPDAQSTSPDGEVSQADMSAGEPMENDAGADSGCHVSTGQGQAPGWALMLFFGGLFTLRRRTVSE